MLTASPLSLPAANALAQEFFRRDSLSFRTVAEASRQIGRDLRLPECIRRDALCVARRLLRKARRLEKKVAREPGQICTAGGDYPGTCGYRCQPCREWARSNASDLLREQRERRGA